jgi:hypothetical protein
MTILDLPEPRQDGDDPHGMHILPYVMVSLLEGMTESFPREYLPHLIAAVEAMKARRAQNSTYCILLDGESILCKRCKRISYNAEDIARLYCGACHLFHEPQ